MEIGKIKEFHFNNHPLLLIEWLNFMFYDEFLQRKKYPIICFSFGF